MTELCVPPDHEVKWRVEWRDDDAIYCRAAMAQTAHAAWLLVPSAPPFGSCRVYREPELPL